MIYWSIFFVVFGLHLFFGWRRGFWLILLELVGMVSGYSAAILFTEPLGNLINRTFAGGGFLPYLIAALVLVVVGSGIFKVPAFFLAVRRKKQEKKGEKVARYPKAGMLLNGVLGLFFALVWVWIVQAGWVAMRLPPQPPTAIEAVSGKVMAAVAAPFFMRNATAGPEFRRLFRQLVAAPGPTLNNLNQVAGHPEWTRLIQDKELKAKVDKGDWHELADSKYFKRMFRNPQFGEAVRQLDLVAKEQDLEAHKQQLAKTFAEVWRKVGELDKDPHVRKLLDDPRLRKMIEQRDVGNLLKEDRFRELVQRILNKEE